ncbi:MAG: DUF4102 domain-containing protein, partial [Gammaproteobacteria bacterium]|nr:DUF4102 domain-containing protein [Gammaproteobacteria bacterium]
MTATKKKSKSHMKPNMTDMWIKSVKPNTEAMEYGDASSPGLRVRITPLGKKTFVYSYSHPTTGTMRRIKIGNYPAVGLKEARSKWSTLSDIRLIEKKDPKEVIAAAKEAEQAEELAKIREEK